MRKLTALLAVLMLCLQVFSGTVVYGATEVGNNILKVNYVFDGSSSIGEGGKLTIHLECENTNSEYPLEDVRVEIDDSSSFSGKLTKIADSINSKDKKQVALELVYKGTGSSLVLLYKFDMNGKTYEKNETVNIIELGSNKGKDEIVDPGEYVPKLRVGNISKIPVITAGESYKLKLMLENYTGHQARNLEIKLKMEDAAKAPLVLNNFEMRQALENISGRTSKEVVFDISTLKNAPEGLYLMKLDIEYYNAYSRSFEVSENVYIRVINNNVSPKIIVDNISVKPSGTASGAIILDLQLKNLGNLKAENLKVTLGGLRSGGFTAYNSTDVKYVNAINGNGISTVSYELMPPTSGAAGSNELVVKLEYRDENGIAYTDQNQIFVPAGEGEGSRPNIAFERIVSPQNTVAPGQEFTVGLDLKNNGGAVAKNIKVSLATDAGIVARSMNPVYLTELGGAKAEKITFKLFAADDTPTKNYPIALNVEYEDAFGNKFNASQYIGVFIENDGGKTVPRIIIDNYSMDPFPVNAGEDFTLKMSFLNTSKTVDVSNIKVTVASEDGTFTPTDSGNTFYIENIPRTKNVERELILHVKPDAEQKSYMLTVNFEYEDEKGNPYTAKETMSARVVQNPRLVTGQLNVMPDTFVGQPVWVYLDFYNMGKSTLYNLMVSIEGDFQGQGLSYYVGNFEPGRTDYIDVSFNAMSPGQQKGSVLFAFEDANGKKTEIRKEFDLNVMEMMQEGPMLDENGMPIDMGGEGPWMDGKPMPGMPGEQAQTSIWVYIGIGAGVLIVAAVLFIILRKRHVRRKELSLDE